MDKILIYKLVLLSKSSLHFDSKTDLPMATNFFFDAHFHATLKKQFAKPAAASDSDAFSNPWKTAVTADFLKKLNDLQKCALRPLVEHSLASQSSLSQLNDNGFKLGIAALFFPDKGLMQLITESKAFMRLINKGKLGDLLVGERFTALQYVNGCFRNGRTGFGIFETRPTQKGKWWDCSKTVPSIPSPVMCRSWCFRWKACIACAPI